MTAIPDTTSELCPEQVMSELFRKHSLAEKIHRIIVGLRSPRDSGAYKYSRLQILRLQAPVAAIAVPFLVLFLLLWIAALKDDSIADDYHPIRLPEPEPLPKLEDPEPLTPLKANPFHNKTPVPGFAETDLSLQPDWAPPSPRLEWHETFAPSRSPVHFPGLFATSFSERQRGALFGGGGTTNTEAAVMRALRWLSAVQESDGSWVQESGGGPGRGSAPAMTGLALLTFLAHSETTGSPEFGSTVQRGLQWLVDNQEADGRFRGRDSHDYSHPIAAYALCEAYALMRLPSLREPAEKSIDVILAGQNPAGGWDYNCRPSGRNDTSYSGWCVQALKAAKMAKLKHNGLDAALRKAVGGLRGNAHPRGGFGYTGPQQSHLTSVGVLCMQLLGAANTAEVKLGLRWLEAASCRWSEPWGKSPIYYWYYVTQAKFHSTKAVWTKWNEQMAVELPGSQTLMNPADPIDNQRGYWKACTETEHCKSYVYNTTLCTLMLEVYYKHLKTFAEPEHLPLDAFLVDGDEIPVGL